MKRSLYRAVLAVAVLAAALTWSGSAPAEAQGVRRYRIRLATLHCNRANESGVFSDGDEPYVILMTIIDDGNIPTLHFQRTSVFDDIDTGERRSPNVDLVHRPAADAIVVVSQVVEHDNSPLLRATHAAIVADWAFDDAVEGGRA